MRPGGYSDLRWTGACARASNSYPSLRVILPEKGTQFIGIFHEKYAHFSKLLWFSGFSPCENRKFGFSQKSWPVFKDFFGLKWDPCLRISCKKRPFRATHPRSAKYVSTPEYEVSGQKFLFIYATIPPHYRFITHAYLLAWDPLK